MSSGEPVCLLVLGTLFAQIAALFHFLEKGILMGELIMRDG